MKRSRFVCGWVAGLTFLVGRGGQTLPSPADPEQARQALRSALDAWQRGEKSESLRGGAPPIHVIDGDWDRDLRLARYQLAPDDRASGPNLLCPVQLSLRDGRGRSFNKRVVYLVGTDPRVSIVREEQ
jgi:hypothetical protein